MIMTIQAWSLKVRDFTVPPRQPSLGAIAPRDGCLGGTVKSLTFWLHGSIVPFYLLIAYYFGDDECVPLVDQLALPTVKKMSKFLLKRK